MVCRSGMTNTIAFIRLSRKTWMNSLMISCLMRSTLCWTMAARSAVPLSQTFLEFSVCRREGEDPEDQKEQGLRVQDPDRTALQEQSLENGHKIPRRDDVRDHLQGPGHVGDGEHEAGEQERRQIGRHHRDLAGNDLGLGANG